MLHVCNIWSVTPVWMDGIMPKEWGWIHFWCHTHVWVGLKRNGKGFGGAFIPLQPQHTYSPQIWGAYAFQLSSENSNFTPYKIKNTLLYNIPYPFTTLISFNEFVCILHCCSVFITKPNHIIVQQPSSLLGKFKISLSLPFTISRSIDQFLSKCLSDSWSILFYYISPTFVVHINPFLDCLGGSYCP